MPERFVRINESRPKVIEFKGKIFGKYVALTYSWGGGKAEMRRLKDDDRERFLQGEI
jgi:hypothetical protein